MPKASSWTSDQVEDLMHMRDVKKLRWLEIAKLLGRSKSACQLKWEKTARPLPPAIRVDSIDRAPPETIEDRDRRAALRPRDLSAFFFGDPPVGYSALDKRERALA